MIEKNHPSLSVGAQCHLLSISRSSFYYAPQGETAMNLARNLNQQSRLAEALELFEPLRSEGDPATEVIVSLIHDKLGNHEESRAILERMAVISASSVWIED